MSACKSKTSLIVRELWSELNITSYRIVTHYIKLLGLISQQDRVPNKITWFISPKKQRFRLTEVNHFEKISGLRADKNTIRYFLQKDWY